MKNLIISIFVSFVVITAIVTIDTNKLETALCGDEGVYQNTIEQMDNYALSPSKSSFEMTQSFEEDSTSILSCSAEKIMNLPVQ